MSVRVGAVDCGTNSIRLLVADLDPATGALTDLDRRMRIVRLGQGVDRTGRLAPDALERTFAACEEYAGVLRAHGVPAERTRFAATSASRDAENRDDFVRGVVDILGVRPEVVSGDQEAQFSFTGATRELTGEHGMPTPYLVVDIGGGSTEFVLGDRDGGGGPLGGHRLRTADGASSRTGRRGGRPADARGGRRDHRGHRRGPGRGGRRRPARPGPHAGRPGRLGDHGVGDRPAAARLRLGRHPPLPGLPGAGPRDQRPAAEGDARRARRDPGDARGPGGRDRARAR